VSDRSFVITAAGVISPAGDTPQDLYAAVRSGMVLAGSLHTALPEESGVGTDKALPDFPVTPIRRFDPGYYLKHKGRLALSRASLLAVTAASRIAERIAQVPSMEVGVAYGTAWGALHTLADFDRAVRHDGPRAIDPLLFTESVASVPATQMALFHGWSAWGATLGSGSASGLEAVRFALERLAEGRARVVVAGGGDGLNLPLLRALWAQGITADASGSFPYGADRSGPVGGEGACVVVVESEQSARGREALPLARIASEAGAFVGVDHEMGRITRGAIASLLREAVDAAGLTPAEIDLLVLPGNGSVDADRAQAYAVADVFGQRTAGPPAVAPKATTGETWGASGPIGVVVALEAMRTGSVPGRPKMMAPDPELPGPNLPSQTDDRPVRHALVLDATAGGQLSALVLSAWSAKR
jgi:3-oxoacyl-(acyl-carrier-protein) synthase